MSFCQSLLNIPKFYYYWRKNKNASFPAAELLEEEKAAIILVFVTPELNVFKLLLLLRFVSPYISLV